jgi:hypothetical protein
MLVLLIEKERTMSTKRWQDWVNLALGLWFLVSPWVLRFHDLGVMSLDFYAAGAALAALAVLGLRRRTLWGEWLTLVLGLWMIGAPWMLRFASNGPAVPDSVGTGAAAALLAVWVILRYTPDPYHEAKQITR